MRGDLLVAVHQLVRLRPREGAPAGELLEPLPFVLVRLHVGVEVHALTVGGVGSLAMSQPVPEFADLSRADDLVTGEAVALDLPPAGLGTRAASGLIDLAAILVLAIGLALLMVLATARRPAPSSGSATIATMIIVFLAAPTALETLTHGRTLGKLALGLRTVRDDGGPISFHHAFVRSLVGIVEIYLLTGTPAFFWPWSARAASGSATTRPARTSSANGSGWRCPHRRRCPGTFATGQPQPTSRRCRSVSPWRSGSSSPGPTRSLRSHAR